LLSGLYSKSAVISKIALDFAGMLEKYKIGRKFLQKMNFLGQMLI